MNFMKMIIESVDRVAEEGMLEILCGDSVPHMEDRTPSGTKRPCSVNIMQKTARAYRLRKNRFYSGRKGTHGTGRLRTKLGIAPNGSTILDRREDEIVRKEIHDMENGYGIDRYCIEKVNDMPTMIDITAYMNPNPLHQGNMEYDSVSSGTMEADQPHGAGKIMSA